MLIGVLFMFFFRRSGSLWLLCLVTIWPTYPTSLEFPAQARSTVSPAPGSIPRSAFKYGVALYAPRSSPMPCYASRQNCGRSMAARPILIKRYARSRFYCAAKGRYVSVQELRQWQLEGIWFVVEDAETGADITRVLLAQEQNPPREPKAKGSLAGPVLRQP
jgi:hypothetical protein